MAYEDMTYEVILHRMINRVSEQYPNIDTREGSILFNALAPAALELAIMYTELDNVLNESFVATASREYLILACEQMGLDTSHFDSRAGVYIGEFNIPVNIGSRWNCGLFNYTVTSYRGVEENCYIYHLKCETEGSAPNSVTGDLTAIDYIPDGLSHAVITGCHTEGEDELSDDEIRAYYYNYVDSTISDGNVKQYEYWCDNYDGIGNYKIMPLAYGPNTVGIRILNTSNRMASPELMAAFGTYLDTPVENGKRGMGNGVMPIGAIPLVDTANEETINVTATISMAYGYTDTSAIDEAIIDYFSSVALKKNVVSYINVGAVILGVEGVESISNLTINGGTSDIILDESDYLGVIPVLGTTTWTVN